MQQVYRPIYGSAGGVIAPEYRPNPFDYADLAMEPLCVNFGGDRVAFANSGHL